MAVARHLGAEFAKEAPQRDTERRFAYAEIDLLRRSGLTALRVPTEYGGYGADARTVCDVLSALGEGDPNIAQMYYIHTYGVGIANFGIMDESGRAELNRRLVEGMMITNAFSEITTKDVFTYSMKVEEQPNGDFLLNGRKFYCTGSLGGDVFFVLAVTPEGDVKIGYVPTDAPGVTIHEDWSGMGQKTTASGTTEFKDVRLPKEYLVDTAPLDVPESIWGGLGQLMFAAIWIGVGRAALKDAVTYVTTKARPWGASGYERAADDPYKQAEIGEMHMQLMVAEGALERALRVREQRSVSEWAAKSEDDRAWVSATGGEANVIVSRAVMDICERLFAVCGASSALEKYAYDRHWRNVRTMSLHDPSDYKVKWAGDWVLNGKRPPVTSHN